MKSKYDTLNANLKKERGLINKKNTKAANLITKLQSKISRIKYERDIYCKKHNNTIIDLNSLIENEVRRINKDYETE